MATKRPRRRNLANSAAPAKPPRRATRQLVGGLQAIATYGEVGGLCPLCEHPDVVSGLLTVAHDGRAVSSVLVAVCKRCTYRTETDLAEAA